MLHTYNIPGQRVQFLVVSCTLPLPSKQAPPAYCPTLSFPPAATVPKTMVFILMYDYARGSTLQQL